MADSGLPEKDENKSKDSYNNLPEYREVKKEEQKDDELENLLDSALDDFEKVIAPPQGAKSASCEQLQDAENSSQNINLTFDWSDEFIQQATEQFEGAMKNLLAEGNFGEELKKLAGASEKALNSQDKDNAADLSSSLASTLKELSDNAEAISNPLTDDEITQLLGNIGLSGDIGTSSDEPEDLINVMKSMMQNLLSKDLLYPALKETVDKYPEWLAANKSTISDADYNRYNRQYEMMRSACSEYEAEKESDSAEVKKARFERILDFMQKVS
ncbi:hypothetical protein CHUAL_002569 [Chamberlinius hualienensis]